MTVCTETLGLHLKIRATWLERIRKAPARIIKLIAFSFFAIAALISAELHAEEALPEPWGKVPQAIVVRSTENVTQGGWVWLLNKAKVAGIACRI